MVRHDPLKNSVDSVALAIATSLLHKAKLAGRDMIHARRLKEVDPDAVHAFRVASRRLRAWQRAYAPWLGDASSKKMRRRLRDIARATNASRDTAVQLAWLARQRRRIAARRRPAVDRLIAKLELHQIEHSADALEAARDFRALADALARRLKRADPEAPRSDEPFGAAAARLIRTHTAELRRRLRRIRGAAGEEEAHQARIAAKRVRYLLEPVVKWHSGGRGTSAARIVAQLRQLQDALGDLHDVQVLEQLLSKEEKFDGLTAIAATLRRRSRRAFHCVEHDWRGDASAPFFSDVAACCADLTRRAGAPAPRGANARTPQ